MNNITEQKQYTALTESRFDVITAAPQLNSLENDKEKYIFSMPPLKINNEENANITD